MQHGYSSLMKNYNLQSGDCQMLKELLPLAKANTQSFLQRFYERIMRFEHAGTFLNSEAVINKHKKKIAEWYLDLFCGRYDAKYFENLERISQTHVQIGLPPHYFNAALHVVRSFMHEMLIENNRLDALPCVDKILDMNLDLLSGVYSDLEQSQMLEAIAAIHYSLKHDAAGVLVFTQAIAEAKTLNIRRHECLMRLRNKNGETLSPAVFLDVAKQIGMYSKLSRAMIDKCFHAFENSDASFSINLCVEDINNEETMRYLRQILRNFSEPARVIFEIVESEYIQDMDKLNEFIQAVRDSGARIAIDDFGAGFSNYDNISKLSPDLIKLDGSLIKDIDTNGKHEAIVANIIDLAKKLGTKTVAEFVHSQAVLHKVQALDTDYVQGFLIQKPKETI